MMARTKTMFVCIAFCLLTVGMPTVSSAQEDKCTYLSGISADKLHQALTGYAGKVMGKEPERWTDADYSNLAANAMACHGQPYNVVEKVNGEIWALKLADARQINSEINRKSQFIAQSYSEFWTSSDDFPACATFLKWKKDDLWHTNNSKEIFGTSFRNMTPDMRGFYKRIAQECLPVMELVLDRWRKHPSQAQGVVSSIIKSIELDALASREKPESLPERLRIVHNGEFLPVAYLRPTTQKVVKRVMDMEQANRIMPTNSIIQISKWASQVEEQDKEGPDLLYARAIKEVVAEHMFRAVDVMRKPVLR